MPIFKYYSPYRRPNFYNYYNPTYARNYTPDFYNRTPSNISQITPPNQQTIKNFSNSEQPRSNSKSEDNVWFDLFGIKLYFDDVLILSLLFFLYKEEVKDEGLFLALVLLLIS